MSTATKIYSPTPQKDNLTPHLRLYDFADKKMWVAWRTELRGNSLTKVRYIDYGRKAESNNPSTWITLTEAVELCQRIKGKGFGICLGVLDCVPGFRMGGIDLDCCRDPTTGEVEKWADTIIKRFGSYAEVSPSGKGVKVFFLYRTDEWDTGIKPLLRGNISGRQWKRHADHDHPPAIELYLTCRYFAVTGNLYGESQMMSVVDAANIKWLAEDFGPRFVGKPNLESLLPISGSKPPPFTPSSGGSDSSRSGRAFRWMRVMHRCGKTYEQAKAVLLDLTDDPGVTDWAATKGMARDEYELKRTYERARPAVGSIDDRLGDIARAIEESKRDS